MTLEKHVKSNPSKGLRVRLVVLGDRSLVRVRLVVLVLVPGAIRFGISRDSRGPEAHS